MEDKPKQIRRIGCAQNQRLRKETFLAMLPDNTKSYFEGMPYENWEIYSFNSNTREVCIRIQSSCGQRMMSCTLSPIVYT